MTVQTESEKEISEDDVKAQDTNETVSGNGESNTTSEDSGAGDASVVVRKDFLLKNDSANDMVSADSEAGNAGQEEDKAFPYVYDNNVLAQDGEETVTMDTLLLRIATQAEYDEQGEYVDTYKEVQKEKELYELKERMESEMEGLLGEIPIKVFIDSII